MSDTFNPSDIDPLDQLLERQKKATAKPEADNTTVPQNADDDEYGINDADREIAEEDAAREAAEAERIAALRAQQEAATEVAMPPQSLDPDYQREAVGHQVTVFEEVSRLVGVISEKHQLEGCLDYSDDHELGPNDPMNPKRRQIIGDLIELYQLNPTDAEYSPEFEQYVLDNWRYSKPVQKEAKQEAEQDADEPAEAIEESRSIAPDVQVNITAQSGTPVEVNIDKDLLEETGVDVSIERTRTINVTVTEVDEQQLLASPAIVRNSQKDGVITPYDSDSCDVPLALPLSAYRCVLKPVNYAEFMRLGNAPTSGNPADIDRRSWTIIYDHVKNVSIGEFKDFEDFLKKTRYGDQQLLLWGILLGAGSMMGTEGDDQITVLCRNEDCNEPQVIKYTPQSIIHVNDEAAKKLKWDITQNVPAGPAAVKHYNEMNSTVHRYRLPKRDGTPSKFIIEIDERPTAWDFLNKRYPLMDTLREQYMKEDMTEDDLRRDPEYGYMMLHALYVTAISIVVNENGKDKEYRYDTWEKIQKIISTSLDMYESNVLFQLVNKVAQENINPIEFYFDGYDCKKCGRHEDRIVISDIGQTLLFRLSRRLQSTTINLTQLAQN